jgi:hypothetical protein
MQTKSVTEIRSLGFTKVNRLVRAHRHLEDLRAAFLEWQAGEIYVCKKTASYRYRFGEKSKSPAPWSKIAEQLFASPAEFALAAVVLGPEPEQAQLEKPALAPLPTPRTRANIIALAQAAA